MKNYSITIARSLELDEINCRGGFDHKSVIDMRRAQCGATRPIEESVLKRLKNHFIEYEQMDADAIDADQQKLVGRADIVSGDTLVLTDDVAHVASHCQANNIPFTSKTFYVVETGMGDVVRTVPVAQPFEPKFGTFVG
ncbi:MAG: hypothetical protein AAF478_11035 [Pseudomonadota bacterium]